MFRRQTFQLDARTCPGQIPGAIVGLLLLAATPLAAAKCEEKHDLRLQAGTGLGPVFVCAPNQTTAQQRAERHLGTRAQIAKFAANFCAQFTDCTREGETCLLSSAEESSPWICAESPNTPCTARGERGFKCDSKVNFVTCRCGKKVPINCTRQHVVPVGEAGAVIQVTVCAQDLTSAARKAVADANVIDQAKTFANKFCQQFNCPQNKTCALDGAKIGLGVDECRPPVVDPGCRRPERGFTCDVRVATVHCKCP